MGSPGTDWSGPADGDRRPGVWSERRAAPGQNLSSNRPASDALAGATGRIRKPWWRGDPPRRTRLSVTVGGIPGPSRGEERAAGVPEVPGEPAPSQDAERLKRSACRTGPVTRRTSPSRSTVSWVAGCQAPLRCFTEVTVTP